MIKASFSGKDPVARGLLKYTCVEKERPHHDTEKFRSRTKERKIRYAGLVEQHKAGNGVLILIFNL
jgi:hypothetical protein